MSCCKQLEGYLDLDKTDAVHQKSPTLYTDISHHLIPHGGECITSKRLKRRSCTLDSRLNGVGQIGVEKTGQPTAGSTSLSAFC